MPKFIPFTDAQKEQAASVDLEEFLRHRGEKLIASGRDKRLASDHSITIRGCEWFDHATEQGGKAISFVKQFYGLSYPEPCRCCWAMISAEVILRQKRKGRTLQDLLNCRRRTIPCVGYMPIC